MLTGSHDARMKNINIQTILRWIALCTIFILLLLTFLGSYYGYVHDHGYNIGDWLINYQGGFVRRGLFGEIALQLSYLTRTSPGIWVVVAQSLSYLCFFGFTTWLLWKNQNTVLFLALVFSPATFLFHLQDFEGGYRKEILFLAVLAFLSWSARYCSDQKFERNFFIILFFYPLFILSHEMLALFMPYLFAVYSIRKKPVWIDILKISGFLLFSFVAFFFCLKYSGSRAEVVAILESLGEYAPRKGSINDLPARAINVFKRNMESLAEGNGKYHYLQSLLLVSVSFIPLRGALKQLAANKVCFFSILLGLLCAMPLFAVATDWGRFIYIQVTSIFLLCLLVDSCQGEKNRLTVLIENQKIHIWLPIILIVLYLYATSWGIEHCCI